MDLLASQNRQTEDYKELFRSGGAASRIHFKRTQMPLEAYLEAEALLSPIHPINHQKIFNFVLFSVSQEQLEQLKDLGVSSCFIGQ